MTTANDGSQGRIVEHADGTVQGANERDAARLGRSSLLPGLLGPPEQYSGGSILVPKPAIASRVSHGHAESSTVVNPTGMTAESLTDQQLQERFRRIDWSFVESRLVPPHDIHPYPARFIPEIPAAAISLVSEVEGDVLDPFCGAGTALTEAARVGRSAVGIDLNPIATLISRVKLHRWTAEDDLIAWHHAENLREAAKAGDTATLVWARNKIPRLDHWFPATSQDLLAGAINYQRTLVDPVWRDRVAVAISSVVVRLSRQESDTRYAAVEKDISRERGAAFLEGAVRKVAMQLAAFAPEHRGGEFTVHTDDARRTRELVHPCSVAAAVFSPPYPNAYEYWLYHKYRMYWLGYDPIQVRAQEFGARPHYSGTGRLSASDFERQMREVMIGVATSLVHGGICCIVIGDSRIRGEYVDNGKLLARLGAEVGLVLVAHTKRVIRSTNRSFNLAVARATHEHVLLLRKP